jgi:hypothetical protein
VFKCLALPTSEIAGNKGGSRSDDDGGMMSEVTGKKSSRENKFGENGWLVGSVAGRTESAAGTTKAKSKVVASDNDGAGKVNEGESTGDTGGWVK